MQHIQTQIDPIIQSRGGGRIASSHYRKTLELCDDFTGLEENNNRYDLLLLVKRVGKSAGFTPRMIQLLDYYMAFTTELDWEEGSRPIVYQSLARTALDLGVTERQIQKLEKQLFEAGAITWNDSGNHKRYGQRDAATGRILYAYGVDLTPLAYLREELQQTLHEKQLYDQAWLQTKREISWYRRQIKALMLEWREEGAASNAFAEFERHYDEIAIQLRTHIRLEEMRILLDRHSSLHSQLLDRVEDETAKSIQATDEPFLPKETANGSSTSETEFAHYKYTTQPINICSLKDTCFQESVVEPSEPNDLVSATGLQHITLRQALLAASDRFLGYLPLKSGSTNWNDVVEAAYQLRKDLRISQQSWSEACGLLGRVGAAVCVLVTDQAMQRHDDPVRQPAAYFRGMIRKARVGDLRLHSSIYGINNLHGANPRLSANMAGYDDMCTK